MTRVDLAVRRAQPADLQTILAIADETAGWLLAKGIRQWESPPSPGIRDVLRGGIGTGNVYLFRLGDSSVLAGFFRVEWQGFPLWPDERNARYLYSLCLRPGCVGRGIGAAVIGWVRTWLKTQGKESLRLDCIAANGFLRGWYEDLGFSFCGIAIDGDFTLALYEIRC